MATKSPTKTTGTKGMTLSRQQMADFFGVALTTVDTWVRAGCPVQQRGSQGVAWEFNSRDVHNWQVDEKVAQATGSKEDGEDNLVVRKMRAETELKELELAKAKGDVVDLPFVQQALAACLAELQVRLRSMPGRLRAALIGCTDDVKFKTVMLKEIDESLVRLSTLDLTGIPEEAEEEEEELAE